MSSRREKSAGFSLVELLVTVGIIAVLIALLLPVLSSVRRAARATRCLANLQQWSTGYQAYLNTNRGRSFILGDFPFRLDRGNNALLWWEVLQPHQPDRSLLVCPEATEPSNVVPRDAFGAWGPHRFWDTPTQVRGPYVGSYGFNGWVLHPRTEAHRQPDHVRLPAKEANRVPVFLDCANFELYPKDSDAAALYGAGAAAGLGYAAMRRHRDGVNVAFLDGHAEHVEVQKLWKLKWSERFQPQDVSIPRK